MTQITDHIAETAERVRKARSGASVGPENPKILAVSKRQPVAAIRSAYECGLRDFGENVVQEALPKIEALAALDICWHFIGRIQSNKTRDIAEHFDWVHTIDRLKIAQRLNDQRPHFAPPLNVCIQINQAGESQKGGIAESELSELSAAVAELPALRLRGLMSLPPATDDPEDSAPHFARLRELRDSLEAEGFSPDTLSMGMSSDLEVAVREGSTIVRVGTAIFGPRPAA
ncbi:MAG: YggS family pyridoxal phosphate-dependent enzyme [Gammaproteobacteria bacterium]